MPNPQHRSRRVVEPPPTPGWLARSTAACLALAGILAGCNAITGAGDLVVEPDGVGGLGAGATGAGASPAGGTTGTSGHPAGATSSSGSAGNTSSSTSASSSAGATTTSASSSTGATSTSSSTSASSSTGATSTSSSTSASSTTSTSSSTSASSTSSSSGTTDPAQHCVDTINSYRKTLGLTPYTRWTANEACVAQEATTDAGKNSAHWSFINQAMCGSNAEDECPGYSVNPLTANDGIDTCLALMWAEKNQSICSGCATCDFPYDNCTNCLFSGSAGECGHYLNMKSKVLSTVACGYSTVGWYAQDFK